MNPFVSIWKAPTETIQYLIDNKTISYGVLLAILSAVSTAVFGFADTGFLASFSLPVILLLSIMLSIIISVASWGFSAVVYTWIGKLLGGTGKIRNMSFAVAASLIPAIWTMPLGVLAVILYGENLFNEPPGDFGLTNMSTGFYIIYNIILLVTSVFAVVILSKGIGLVHNFSAWRGFGTIMIFAGVMFFILMVVLIAVFIFFLFLM